MFRYEVPPVPSAISKRVQEIEHFIVVGMGGSVLPLKAFVDAASLEDQIHFLDTVDPERWKKMSRFPKALFCVVSKSGETLETKTLLDEIIKSNRLKECFIVTDPSQGFLRKFAKKNNCLSLEIPPEIGGRFTHFTIFHRALLERFGVDFDSLLKHAQSIRDELKKNSERLQHLFSNLFESGNKQVVIWAYGDRLFGLAQWMQQALAESLGKKTSDGKRVGVFPVVLRGPQDQHSVLQFLIEGPQTASLWFLMPKKSNQGLEKVLSVLAESTYKTFEERLGSSETLQPLIRWDFGEGLEGVVTAIVTLQAFVEYAGEHLNINAFDQPGVERGKQIARELMK